MHHDGPVALAVAADELEPEPFRLDVVHLDGGDGLLPARGVGHLDVDLRTVERGLARRLVERAVPEGLPQRRLRPPPGVVVAQVPFPRPAQREPEPADRQAQQRVGLLDGLEGQAHLVDDLVRAAERVRVVEADLADAAQPGEDAGQFAAEHRAEFGVPDGQVAVAVRAGGVDLGVVRAVRRAQHVLLVPDAHGREHVGGELLPVPGPLEQSPFAQHRGVDPLTTGRQ